MSAISISKEENTRKLWALLGDVFDPETGLPSSVIFEEIVKDRETDSGETNFPLTTEQITFIQAIINASDAGRICFDVNATSQEGLSLCFCLFYGFMDAITGVDDAGNPHNEILCQLFGIFLNSPDLDKEIFSRVNWADQTMLQYACRLCDTNTGEQLIRNIARNTTQAGIDYVTRAHKLGSALSGSITDDDNLKSVRTLFRYGATLTPKIQALIMRLAPSLRTEVLNLARIFSFTPDTSERAMFLSYCYLLTLDRMTLRSTFGITAEIEPSLKKARTETTNTEAGGSSSAAAGCGAGAGSGSGLSSSSSTTSSSVGSKSSAALLSTILSDYRMQGMQSEQGKPYRSSSVYAGVVAKLLPSFKSKESIEPRDP